MKIDSYRFIVSASSWVIALPMIKPHLPFSLALQGREVGVSGFMVGRARSNPVYDIETGIDLTQF